MARQPAMTVGPVQPTSNASSGSAAMMGPSRFVDSAVLPAADASRSAPGFGFSARSVAVRC